MSLERKRDSLKLNGKSRGQHRRKTARLYRYSSTRPPCRLAIPIRCRPTARLDGSATYVGKGDSKLALELIFDVSGTDSTHDRDVRRMTERVAYFMGTSAMPGTAKVPDDKKKKKEKPKFQVPGLRFQWGSFLFDGILLSMNENLELWSETGNPLDLLFRLA